jgi:hypothetical protein
MKQLIVWIDYRTKYFSKSYTDKCAQQTRTSEARANTYLTQVQSASCA